MADPIYRLGRKPAVRDPRNLKLAKYIAAAQAAGTLPVPPVALNWSMPSVAWGMMLNNSLGDCVCAAAGHTILNWLAHAAPPGARPSDNQIEDVYCNACGYVRGNHSTDTGCSLQEVLNYWRTHGIAIGGEPVTYTGTLVSGSFQANENLVSQGTAPQTAEVVLFDKNGKPVAPSQKPQWSEAGSANITNTISPDGTTDTISGPGTAAGNYEYITVKEGSLTVNELVQFQKNTGILVSQSGSAIQVTSAFYTFQPGDVMVGASSGAQFRVTGIVSATPKLHRIHAYVGLGTAMAGWSGPQVTAAQADLEVKLAIMLFGAAYTAVQLPISAQSNWSSVIWDVPAGGPIGNGKPNSWGGHSVPIIGWDANVLYFVTWGMVCRMTWNFYHTYFDEAYAVLSTDWMDNATKLAASGFDFGQLVTDLAQVTA